MESETIYTDQYYRQYVIRYVIAQQNPEMGGRKIVGPCQGQYTYATRQEAETHLTAMLENNSQDTLRQVYHLPLSVAECRCYPGHYDPLGPYL